MVRKSFLLILALAGFASADTGFPSTIKVTETDNSPSCVAGQIKFGAGQVSCSGQTATVTITGGGGGASSLAVTAGPARSSPTSDVIFNPNQFSGSVSGSSITISLQSGVGMSPNATYYIQVRDTLQSGATFYVSSGAVAGKLSVVGPSNGNAIESSVSQSGNATFGKAGSFTCSTGGGSASSCIGAYGVGQSSSTGSDGVGLSGITLGDGISYGVSAQALGTGTNYGGYFSALNGSTNYGIFVANGYSVMSGSASIRGPDGLGVTYGVSASSVSVSSLTASGQIRATSLLVNSTFTINSVGVCLADGTNCTSTGSGGMSPGATYYIQVRDTLQTGATFYVSSGTVSGQLSVSTLTFIGSGLLTATQNGFTGPLLISTGIPTSGQAVIAASSYSITATPLRSTILAVDSNGVLISTTISSSGGSGSGSVVASPYGQVPYYSGVDTNTLTGNPNFTMDTSSWTVYMDSVATRGVLFDYGTSSMTVSSMTAANVTLPSLTSKSCIGTDSTGLVITGTCGGSGGSSSLAVTVGVSRSSPTSDVIFNSSQMYGSISGSSITINLQPVSISTGLTEAALAASSASATYQNIRQAIALSSFSATQPILYNNATGGFSATLISATTGMMGTLQEAQFPTLTGDLTGSAGSLTVEVNDDSHNHTGSTLSGIIGATITSQIPSSVLPSTISYTVSTQTITGAKSFTSPSGVSVTYGVTASSVAASSITASGQMQTTGITVNELTASQFVVSDANKKLSSSLNGSSLTSLTGANIASGIPSSVLPSTVSYTDKKETISGHKTYSSSQTYSGALYVSSSVVTSGEGAGTSGQVLQSQGSNLPPKWATSSGGGHTIQDEGVSLASEPNLNFTGSGVSCVDNAGSSRTDCTINSGAATAGGNSGNVQFNQGGSIVGASAFNVWTSSIVVSTGASTGYELYGATLAIVSSTTLSGITKIFASTFTNTAQWDQQNSITFSGRQGYTDQIMKSSGTGVSPKWGAIHKIMTTTATITATGTTPSNVLMLQYNLVDKATYYVRCELVFRTTATPVGAGAGLFTTVGSTASASVRIPVAADGTAGAYHGWITTNADSVLGTGVQAANISYLMSLDGVVFAGPGASVYPTIVAEGPAGQMTLQAGSNCLYQGDDPRP